MSFVDYYELLGVGRQAGPEEVKKAYRRLALLHHPDKNPGNVLEATERFKVIKAAADTLGDKAKKARYDAQYRQWCNKRKREEERDSRKRRKPDEEARNKRRREYETESESEDSECEYWNRAKRSRKDKSKDDK